MASSDVHDGAREMEESGGREIGGGGRKISIPLWKSVGRIA